MNACERVMKEKYLMKILTGRLALAVAGGAVGLFAQAQDRGIAPAVEVVDSADRALPSNPSPSSLLTPAASEAFQRWQAFKAQAAQCPSPFNTDAAGIRAHAQCME